MSRNVSGTAYQAIEHDADGRPFRVITATMEAGLSVRIMPDRGLDIADCWYRGRALHWDGWAPVAAPVTGLHGAEWERHFFGGILTTCGLANVGEPSEGHGLHGRYNHLPASRVSVEHVELDGSTSIVITGSIAEATLDGGLLTLERTITLASGVASLSVRDVVTNHGSSPTAAPLLYHLNFGGSLLAGDCHVAVDDRVETVNEIGDWQQLPGGWQYPGQSQDREPVTVEHLLSEGTPTGIATISSATTGIVVAVTWDRLSQPRLLQWINTYGTDRVVALEPANCGTKGRSFDRSRGTLPVLKAGESRTSSFTIKAERHISAERQRELALVTSRTETNLEITR